MGTESLTFVCNKAGKMGKKWFWVLLLVPFLGLSQSKRKIRIEAEKQKAALISNLKSHIDYLASDALEGRRTGTAGADAAMDYLVKQYENLINPFLLYCHLFLPRKISFCYIKLPQVYYPVL